MLCLMPVTFTLTILMTMGILAGVGLEVEVLVNHAAAEEYPCRQLNSNESLETTAVYRRYIQSQENAVFAFRCGVRAGDSPAKDWINDPSNAILFEVNIDNRQGLESLKQHVEAGALSVTIGALLDRANDEQREFRFASIPTGLSIQPFAEV